VPALRVIKTEDKHKKDADKKYFLFLSLPSSLSLTTTLNFRNKKKARREDMRKSVLFARAQLIGSADAENEPAQLEQAPHHITFDMRVLMCPVGDLAEVLTLPSLLPSHILSPLFLSLPPSI
jgi:hypothetical protein